MDYNDIIVIMLLVIIIMGLGLILLKKEYSQSGYSAQFAQTEYPNSHPKNNLSSTGNSSINLPRSKHGTLGNDLQTNNNNFVNGNMRHISNAPCKNMESRNNQNRGITINDKLANIKNNTNNGNDNDNSIVLKNNKNLVNNKIKKNNIYIDDKFQNNNIINNKADLESLDNNSLNNLNNLKNLKNKNNGVEKSKYINNEQINKKVIIDDYSEYDNIKSLNSMDNTLSDLISIVEKEK
jgi:hypothetical protein